MNGKNNYFEPISIVIKTDRHGKTVLSNTTEGLIEYRYVKDEKHFRKILAIPIILIAIWQGKNEKSYEIDLNGEIISLPKMQLINHIIKKTNLAYVSGGKLKNSISIILRALTKRDNIKPEKIEVK